MGTQDQIDSRQANGTQAADRHFSRSIYTIQISYSHDSRYLLATQPRSTTGKVHLMPMGSSHGSCGWSSGMYNTQAITFYRADQAIEMAEAVKAGLWPGDAICRKCLKNHPNWASQQITVIEVESQYGGGIGWTRETEAIVVWPEAKAEDDAKQREFAQAVDDFLNPKPTLEDAARELGISLTIDQTDDTTTGAAIHDDQPKRTIQNAPKWRIPELKSISAVQAAQRIVKYIDATAWAGHYESMVIGGREYAGDRPVVWNAVECRQHGYSADAIVVWEGGPFEWTQELTGWVDVYEVCAIPTYISVEPYSGCVLAFYTNEGERHAWKKMRKDDAANLRNHGTHFPQPEGDQLAPTPFSDQPQPKIGTYYSTQKGRVQARVARVVNGIVEYVVRTPEVPEWTKVDVDAGHTVEVFWSLGYVEADSVFTQGQTVYWIADQPVKIEGRSTRLGKWIVRTSDGLRAEANEADLNTEPKDGNAMGTQTAQTDQPDPADIGQGWVIDYQTGNSDRTVGVIVGIEDGAAALSTWLRANGLKPKDVRETTPKHYCAEVSGGRTGTFFCRFGRQAKTVKVEAAVKQYSSRNKLVAHYIPVIWNDQLNNVTRVQQMPAGDFMPHAFMVNLGSLGGWMASPKQLPVTKTVAPVTITGSDLAGDAATPQQRAQLAANVAKIEAETNRKRAEAEGTSHGVCPFCGEDDPAQCQPFDYLDEHGNSEGGYICGSCHSAFSVGPDGPTKVNAELLLGQLAKAQRRGDLTRFAPADDDTYLYSPQGIHWARLTGYPKCAYCDQPLTENERDPESGWLSSSHWGCTSPQKEGRFAVVIDGHVADGLRYTTKKRADAEMQHYIDTNPQRGSDRSWIASVDLVETGARAVEAQWQQPGFFQRLKDAGLELRAAEAIEGGGYAVLCRKPVGAGGTSYGAEWITYLTDTEGDTLLDGHYGMASHMEARADYDHRRDHANHCTCTTPKADSPLADELRMIAGQLDADARGMALNGAAVTLAKRTMKQLKQVADAAERHQTIQDQFERDSTQIARTLAAYYIAALACVKPGELNPQAYQDVTEDAVNRLLGDLAEDLRARRDD